MCSSAKTLGDLGNGCDDQKIGTLLKNDLTMLNVSSTIVAGGFLDTFQIVFIRFG